MPFDEKEEEQPSETLAGQTFLRLNGGQPMAHDITFILDGRSVNCQIAAVPGVVAPPLNSTLPEVRKYIAGIIVRLAMTAFAKRQPVAKKDDAPRDEVGRPMISCPVCDGFGGPCGYCEGEGFVTHRQAEDWKDTHDGA